MILYKPVADRKPKADTFDFTFGGEKAVENFVKVLFPDAGAGIGYFSKYGSFMAAGDHRQGAALGHGVPGVGHHV